jgi:predicted TIM-barrel fold metal-dependent hydrolase
MKNVLAPCVRRSLLFVIALFFAARLHAQTPTYDFNDSHFHLTNFTQEGPSIRDFLAMMDGKAGRVAIFASPLQQQWSYRIDGDHAPTYYLHSDSPLYYYSFADAQIAMAYKSLPKEQQARFDPFIIGFNPSDMYAADHIRRVLQTFPGVFTGIGELIVHKEFVSGKISGGSPSLIDPALDRILDFCAESGLLVILHNDIDIPFAAAVSKDPSQPVYLAQIKALFQRHPRTSIIWAHTGLGRVVAPPKNHLAIVDAILRDPDFHHVNVDISWDETAKYIVASPESLRQWAELIERYPDRFLFGSDTAAPADQSKYLKIFNMYEPLWKALTPETSRKVRLANYERLFDQARRQVRAWESSHASAP